MVWIGRCPITDKAGARSDEGRLPLPSEATTLLFFLVIVVVCLAIYSLVPQKHIR